MSALGASLSAELWRFFSRRVMRGAFVFGILLSTLVLFLLTVRSDFRYDRSSSGPGVICVQPAPTSGAGTGGTASGPRCRRAPEPERVRHDHRLKIGDNYSGTVGGVGVAMVFAAFVIGASFIGAEFGAGSLGTQLLFEPRRNRVVGMKAAAVAIGSAMLSAFLLLYIGLLQWLGSQLRGSVSGLDGAWFAARAGDVLRVSAAVALAAVAAYAITVVTRRTVAGVAALLVVGWASNIVGVLSAWRWVAKFNPASAFVVVAVDPRIAASDRARVLTAGGGFASACIWSAGLLIVGAVVFGRREVR